MRPLLTFILILAACAEPGAVEATSTTQAPTTTTTVATTTTTTMAPAITTGPTAAAGNFGLFDLPNDSRSRDALDDLGVGWVRLQYRLGERDPNTVLQATQDLADAGVGIWLTLHQRDPGNVADPALLAATERGSLPALDETRYQNDVQTLIEAIVAQIEGAGGDAGTGLIVQFSNEVIPSDYAPDQPTRYFHGTGDEYLRMLDLTSQAVKTVDPNIGFAAGGISSGALDSILAYSAGEDRFEPIAQWNERMLAEGTFDWVDVHIRGEIDTIADRLEWVRTLWDGPIASTEVGGLCDSNCSAPDVAAYTPEVQAADLALRMTTLLAEGVDIAFWASLVESPDQEPQYEAEGLMTPDWNPKPAYATYRDLIAELTE